jgi:neutral trehalase
VVPGGRFEESYYWDSYWIIRGLLICDRTETAWGVISNLLEDVTNFGFVPNGGRIYYLDRSQPPLLTLMIAEYLNHVGWSSDEGKSVLQQTFSLLEIEYAWWMDAVNGHVVSVTFDGQLTYTLNKYHSNRTDVRPESYKEDIETCSVHTEDPSSCYQNIRTAAETGWDFSSRWLQSPFHVNMTSIASISTDHIIPADLNAILYRVELALASMAAAISKTSDTETVVGDNVEYYAASSEYYILQAHTRYNAIAQVLWDSSASKWRDFNLTSNSQIIRVDSTRGSEQGEIAHIGSWIPMWGGLATHIAVHEEFNRILADPLSVQSESIKSLRASTVGSPTVALFEETLSAVRSPRARRIGTKHSQQTFQSTINSDSIQSQLVSSLQASGLVQAAGVLTSTLRSTQQWDSPNAWPPLVLMTIEGLRQLGTSEAQALAVWLYVHCYCGFLMILYVTWTG